MDPTGDVLCPSEEQAVQCAGLLVVDIPPPPPLSASASTSRLYASEEDT